MYRRPRHGSSERSRRSAVITAGHRLTIKSDKRTAPERPSANVRSRRSNDVVVDAKHLVRRDVPREPEGAARRFGSDRRLQGRVAEHAEHPVGVIPRVVAFHDTPRGRYRTLRKITSSTDQLTIAPATPATLARDINDLLVELANPS